MDMRPFVFASSFQFLLLELSLVPHMSKELEASSSQHMVQERATTQTACND
jgi:hypothetical protein